MKDKKKFILIGFAVWFIFLIFCQIYSSSWPKVLQYLAGFVIVGSGLYMAYYICAKGWNVYGSPDEELEESVEEDEIGGNIENK